MLPENSKPPYVVVVGLDHMVGLQTARIFSARKIPVIGIVKNPGHFCSKTNVCEKILNANTTNGELIDTLIELGKKLTQKAVLVPCRDMSVLIVSRNRNKLEPYYLIALPEANIVEILMDKLSFLKFCIKGKLPIPESFILNNRKEAVKASSKLDYPCILKPPIKTQRWERSTSTKAFKIFDQEKFMEIYDQCCQWSDILIAQQWITGSDKNLYSCNCYFTNQSESLVSFTAKKLRQWPPETGETSLGIECRNNTVLYETERLFKKVSFKGLGYVEMKKDEDSGKYFIIEPNIGRPTGRSALAEACGVELLFSMYCDMIGRPIPKQTQQLFVGVKWINILTDTMSSFIYIFKGKLPLLEWIKSLKGKKTYAIYSSSDLLPFFDQFRFGLFQIFKNFRRNCLNKLENIKG